MFYRKIRFLIHFFTSLLFQLRIHFNFGAEVLEVTGMVAYVSWIELNQAKEMCSAFLHANGSKCISTKK